MGGDGWAYDIGYGGLDHVLASGQNVNVLVLDTEVYSNTGGQMSKATPRGAVAKFAAAASTAGKKDLAMDGHQLRHRSMWREWRWAATTPHGQGFPGSRSLRRASIIIAYSHCIAHGYDMATGWISRRLPCTPVTGRCCATTPTCAEGKNPFQLDSRAPSIPFKQYAYQEARYTMLARSNPEVARELLHLAQEDVQRQWGVYSNRAAMPGNTGTPSQVAPDPDSSTPQPVTAGEKK